MSLIGNSLNSKSYNPLYLQQQQKAVEVNKPTPQIVEKASTDESGKTNWKDYYGNSDFQEYSQKGSAIQNPTYKDATKGIAFGNFRPFADNVNNIVTFSRDNSNEIKMAAVNNTGTVGNPKYSEMTDDEVNMYNYLLAKENEGLLSKGTSESFLKDIDQSLLSRSGKNKADIISNLIKSDKVSDKVGGALLASGASIGGGENNAFRGIKQVGNKTSLENKEIDYTAQRLRENLQDVGRKTKSGNSIGQAAFDLGYTVGNMLPNLAVSAVAGPTAGSIALGVSAGGSAKKQALDEGKTLEEANVYGALIGASEALLQRTMGGIISFGGDLLGKWTGKLANKVAPTMTSVATQKIGNVMKKLAPVINSKLFQLGNEARKEFNEEYAQSIIEPVIRNIAFDENNEFKLFTEDALYSGILGAINSAMFNTPKMLSKSSVDTNVADDTASQDLPQFQNDSPARDVLVQTKNYFIQEEDIGNGGKSYSVKYTINNDDRVYPTGQVFRTSDEAQNFINKQETSSVVDSYTRNMPTETEIDLRNAKEQSTLEQQKNQYQKEQTENSISQLLRILQGETQRQKDQALYNARAEYDENRSQVADDLRFYEELKRDSNANAFDVRLVFTPSGNIQYEIYRTKRVKSPEGKSYDAVKTPLERATYTTMEDARNAANQLNANYYNQLYGDSPIKVTRRQIKRAMGEEFYNRPTEKSMFGETETTNQNTPVQDTIVENKATKKASKQTTQKQTQQPKVEQNQPIVETQNPINTPQDTANPLNFTPEAEENPSYKYSQSKDTTLRFEKERQRATGYTPAEYRELFKYRPMSNEESMNFAKDVLFDDVGEFLGKSNPTEFAKVKQELLSKDSWTNVEVDMGHLIEQELMKVSSLSDANRQSYKDWIKAMIPRAKTEVGRALQANSKWSSKGNLNGAEGRAKALEILENSNKSKVDQDAIFDKATTYSSEVLANENNPEALKGIILDVANQRGALSTPWGTKSKIRDYLLNKSLNQMTTEELAQLAYNSASSLVEDVKPRDIGQIIKSIQVLNMLSSPTTPVTNIASNTSFYGIDNLAMKGAAIIDAAVARKTGTRSVVNEKALSSKTKDAAIKGMMNSIAEITLGIDMGGGNRYGVTKGTFRGNGGFLERVMHTVEVASGYALNATDEFYKGAARATEADIQAAIDSGKIKTNDVNYAKNMADDLALYRTFQNNSKLAAILNTVHDALNVVGIGDSGKKIAGQKVGKFGVGDLVSPFTKIAANLAQVAIDYSPTKAVQGTIELVKVCSGIDTATSSQAKAVSDVARGLTGTGIAIVFAELAKIGIIRRADDEDEDVAKLNAAEGRQGTQINLSAAERLLKGESTEWQYGDQLVDLSRLEPFNFMVNLGLVANENEDEQETIVSIFKPSTNANAIVDAMADLPVAESIGGLAKDVLKYNKPIGESLATFVGRTAISSVTPNILAAYAKGNDEYKRSITSGDTISEQLEDYAKRRIPGLRETLPTTVDVNGNEQKEVGMGAALFNPFAPNTYTQSDVSKEMERVRKATGVSTFYPTTRSQREIKYTKDGVEHVKYLDYDARQKFQKLNNQTQNKEMEKMIKTGYYQDSTDKEKAEMLQYCYDYAYEISKESVLGEDAVNDWILDVKNGEIDLPNYVQYKMLTKDLKADKDASGKVIDGSLQKKVANAINSMEVDDKTKDALYLFKYNQKTLNQTPWNFNPNVTTKIFK